MLFLTPGITAYCLILALVLGAVFASFLGCMGWRICNGKSVLKGRCAYCKASIAPMNLYGGILLAVVFVLTTLRFDITWNLILMLCFVSILYLVSVTDIYEQIIPDSALFVAILIRIVYFVLIEGFQWKGILELFIDGIAVSLPLLFLVLIMEKILKKEAMGGGDIKLLFVTGMYIGWAENLLAIFFACIIGIVVGIVQMRRQEGVYFPFGPSIAAGAVISMLLGEQIIQANW